MIYPYMPVRPNAVDERIARLEKELQELKKEREKEKVRYVPYPIPMPVYPSPYWPERYKITCASNNTSGV